MATIDKKLIHFEKLADFQSRLAAGDILDRSMIWIKDAKQIWTHGTYYDCNTPDAVLFVEQILTDSQKQQACGNIGAVWTAETNGVEYPSVTIN